MYFIYICVCTRIIIITIMCIKYCVGIITDGGVGRRRCLIKIIDFSHVLHVVCIQNRGRRKTIARGIYN